MRQLDRDLTLWAAQKYKKLRRHLRRASHWLARIDPNTTLGPATGDLSGAVAATLTAPPAAGPQGTVIFHIQHHWVTNSGDNIFFEPAIATTQPISQTLFAVITYHVRISGGTGKFAGATGELDNIGEADLVRGTAFRYSAQVCFADPD